MFIIIKTAFKSNFFEYEIIIQIWTLRKKFGLTKVLLFHIIKFGKYFMGQEGNFVVSFDIHNSKDYKSHVEITHQT